MTDKKADDAKTPKEQADESKSAAAKVLQVDAEEAAINPYPAYDLMSLEDLRSLAKERDVHINADVEKAHLITELRAKDTQV